METVTLKHEGQEYKIDSATLEKCKVKPEPTWNRQEVLRGEWIPPMGSAYYRTNTFTDKPHPLHYNPERGDGDCVAVGFFAREGKFTFNEAHARGIRFFPNEQLAEEFLTIAEGKWLPDKDLFFHIYPNLMPYGNSGLTNCGARDKWSFGTTNGDAMATCAEAQANGFKFFPSLKQRDEYISKHKKQERPLVGKEAIIDGVTYKLQ